MRNKFNRKTSYTDLARTETVATDEFVIQKTAVSPTWKLKSNYRQKK